MRANSRMQRLHVTADLALNEAFEATAEQFNYLANVLRFEDGAELLVFNGRHGEWRNVRWLRRNGWRRSQRR